MSPQAHSTLFLKENDYKLKKSNRFTREVKTSKYFDNEEYTLVEGCNDSFEYAKLSRLMIVLKKYPVVILLDKAATESEEKIYQNFNLSPETQIGKYEDNIAIVSTKSNKKVTFTQLGNITKTIDIVPSQTEPVQAIVTSGYGKAVETNQLRFATDIQNDNQYAFKTIINMDDSLDIQIKKLNESEMIISVNREDIFINI